MRLPITSERIERENEMQGMIKEIKKERMKE
jgi:hypothetical protein